MHRVRKAERQIIGHGRQNALGERAALVQRGNKGARLAALQAGSRSRQRRGRMFVRDGADFPVHGPTRAALFDDGSDLVEPHMPDLRFAGLCAVKNFPIHDQTAAHAAAERDIENWIAPLPCTAHRLAQRATIRVVVNQHGSPRALAQPVAEREIRPAFDLMGAADFPRAPVHRSAVAHAHRRDLVRVENVRECGFNLRANARAATRRVHVEAPALKNLRGLVAHEELQLGAADFDGEEVACGCGHGVWESNQ